jgi:hypothetical protein
LLHETVIQTAARRTDSRVTGREEWGIAAIAVGACGGEECVKGLVGPFDGRRLDGADEFRLLAVHFSARRCRGNAKRFWDR